MNTRYKSATRLLLLALFISLLHHTDHILRKDHSGWPFLSAVSPFTYSLLVYPIFLSIFLVRSKVYRISAAVVLFLAATISHLTVEPLRDKYHTWTYGSDLPQHVGEQNMLGINSPYLGAASIAIAVALSMVMLLVIVRLVKADGRMEARQTHAT